MIWLSAVVLFCLWGFSRGPPRFLMAAERMNAFELWTRHGNRTFGSLHYGRKTLPKCGLVSRCTLTLASNEKQGRGGVADLNTYGSMWSCSTASMSVRQIARSSCPPSTRSSVKYSTIRIPEFSVNFGSGMREASTEIVAIFAQCGDVRYVPVPLSTVVKSDEILKAKPMIADE